MYSREISALHLTPSPAKRNTRTFLLTETAGVVNIHSCGALSTVSVMQTCSPGDRPIASSEPGKQKEHSVLTVVPNHQVVTNENLK